MEEGNDRLVHVTWEDGMWSDRTVHRHGETVELHDHPPTHPSSAVFKGWFTLQTGGVRIQSPFVAERDITVFAQWEVQNQEHSVNVDEGQKRMIEIQLGDGQPREIYWVEHGSTIANLPALTRAGYVFAGWYDPQGKQYPSTYRFLQDGVKVIAHWTPIQYNLNWELNGKGTLGTNVYKRTFTVEDWGFSPPAECRPIGKGGNTFVGWTPLSIPAETYSDFTFTAQWNQQKFTIRFLKDGVVVDQMTCDYGETIEQPPLVEKDGHEFTGWQDNSSGNVVAFPYQVTRDSDFSARWQTNTYTVTWHYRRGQDYTWEQRECEWGSRLTFPERPSSVDGYEFIGWYDGRESGNQVQDGVAVSGNMDIWAWYRGGCTVAFNPNGGTLTQISAKFPKGSAIGEDGFPVLEQPGYVLTGWVDSSGRQVTGETVVNSNMQVTAQWRENLVDVVLHGNGGVWREMRSNNVYGDGLSYDLRDEYTQQVFSGVEFVLDQNPFEYVGKQFVGWSETQYSTTEDRQYGYYDPSGNWNSTEMTRTEELKLYAVWKPVIPTLTFDPNGGAFSDGGTGSRTVQGTYYGQQCPSEVQRYLSVNKVGNVFNGWYDGDTCRKVENWDFPVFGDKFFTAKWTEEDAQEAEDIPDTPTTPPESMVKEGYNLVSPESDGRNKFTPMGDGTSCSATRLHLKYSGPTGGGLIYKAGGMNTSCNPFTMSVWTNTYQCDQFPGEYYYKVSLLRGIDRQPGSLAEAGSSSSPIWQKKERKFLGWKLRDENGNFVPGQPADGSDGKTYYWSGKDVYINCRYTHSICVSGCWKQGFSLYAKIAELDS